MCYVASKVCAQLSSRSDWRLRERRHRNTGQARERRSRKHELSSRAEFPKLARFRPTVTELGRTQPLNRSHKGNSCQFLAQGSNQGLGWLAEVGRTRATPWVNSTRFGLKCYNIVSTSANHGGISAAYTSVDQSKVDFYFPQGRPVPPASGRAPWLGGGGTAQERPCRGGKTKTKMRRMQKQQRRKEKDEGRAGLAHKLPLERTILRGPPPAPPPRFASGVAASQATADAAGSGELWVCVGGRLGKRRGVVIVSHSKGQSTPTLVRPILASVGDKLQHVGQLGPTSDRVGPVDSCRS